MQGQRYLALDGLRGIAAIAVVLMHARIGALHGYLAVDLFFILSGFVIARSYEGALASGELGFGQYVRLRFERLYPMLFFGGLVGLAFYGMGLSEFRPESDADLLLGVIAQFTLVPCLATALVYFPLNNPQWSILWELAANFAHAAGLTRASNRVLLALVLLCVPGLAAVAWLLGNLGMGCTKVTFWAGLPRVGFGFLAGVLLYRTRGQWEGRVPQVSFTWPVIAFLAVVSMPPQLVPIGPWFAAYDVGVVTLLFVPLVMLTVRAEAGPAAHALGVLSYPLYALNEPAALALVAHNAPVGARVAAVAALVLLSWAVGRYVDEPLNAMRRRARRSALALRAQAASA